MFPRLTTARLVLDAFTLDDVPALVELAGNPEIYATTLLIPRPYTAADAQKWIAGHLPGFLNSQSACFAVRHDGRLVGAVGLQINRAHDRGTLGYWIGRPYWGHGYGTEAVRAALGFYFQHFHLEKIEAYHFAGNPASGRVMEKAGLTHEGFHPRHIKKDGAYIDEHSYGITREVAAAADLLGENSGPGNPPTAPAPAKPRGPDDPPYAEELTAPGTGAIERALVLRHFLGKSVSAMEEELRVYSKSLAPEFAHLSPVALDYYLPSARAYLESEFSEGDWDFAHGLVASLTTQLRGGVLSKETRARAQAVVRHVRDNAARFFIETGKQPFAGWVAEALAE